MRSSKSKYREKKTEDKKKRNGENKKEKPGTKKRKSKLHVPPVVDFKLKFKIFIGKKEENSSVLGERKKLIPSLETFPIARRGWWKTLNYVMRKKNF